MGILENQPIGMGRTTSRRSSKAIIASVCYAINSVVLLRHLEIEGRHDSLGRNQGRRYKTRAVGGFADQNGSHNYSATPTPSSAFLGRNDNLETFAVHPPKTSWIGNNAANATERRKAISKASIRSQSVITAILRLILQSSKHKPPLLGLSTDRSQVDVDWLLALRPPTTQLLV